MEYEISICKEDTSIVELTFPGDSQASGIIFGEEVLDACRNTGFAADAVEVLTLAQDHAIKNHTEIPSTRALTFDHPVCLFPWHTSPMEQKKTLTCLLIHTKLE